MKKIENLTLIEDEFSDVEAREILTGVFSSKINFHKIKNWSTHVRFGTSNELEQQRIIALQNEVKKLQMIISEAKAKNKRLLISAQITISLLD